MGAGKGRAREGEREKAKKRKGGTMSSFNSHNSADGNTDSHFNECAQNVVMSLNGNPLSKIIRVH